MADALLTGHHLCPALQRPAVYLPKLVMEEQGRWRTWFICSRADKETVGMKDQTEGELGRFCAHCGVSRGRSTLESGMGTLELSHFCWMPDSST